jgi:Domain of unknown function (DUF4157)
MMAAPHVVPARWRLSGGPARYFSSHPTTLKFRPNGTVTVTVKERIVGIAMQRAMARNDSPARSPAAAPPAVHETLRSRGQLLDAGTRAYFGSRYSYDFSAVRVHADQQAGETARSMGAAAYTVGSQIVFAEGRYQPGTPAGRRLLAHELVHVAQQRNAPVPGTQLEVGRPSDDAERAADVAAQHALAHAAARPVAAIDAPATVRRVAHETWAGYFDNDLQYDLTKETDGKGNGAYGSPIQIRFTPKPVVHADQVALVQTAVSTWNDQPRYTGTDEEQAATEARSTPGGTHIDQLNRGSTTPLVGMKNPPSGGDLAASVQGRNARFGIPSAQDEDSRKAWMFDPAGFGPIPDDAAASQSLETAALAVSGPQRGVYYGSVSWGWDKASGATTATQKPFRLVSKDAPTAEFSSASELWNKSKTDQDGPRIGLPVTAGRYVARAGLPLMEHAAGGKKVASLDLNARVEITGQADPKHPDWSSVIVTEGSHAGQQGWVETALLGTLTRKKSM